MSRPSKSALLEQEQMVQEALRAERLAEVVRVEAEKKRLHDEANAKAHDARMREWSSCWCGINHQTGERLTEKRERPATMAARLSEPSRSIFVGNLPYELSEKQITDAIAGLLGISPAHAVRRFRLLKDKVETATPDNVDAAEDCASDSFWTLDNIYAPRHPPRTHKGSGFLMCRSQEEARGVIEQIHGHELIGNRGRRFAIRADFAKSRPERNHRPSFEDVKAYYRGDA